MIEVLISKFHPHRIYFVYAQCPGKTLQWIQIMLVCRVLGLRKVKIFGMLKAELGCPGFPVSKPKSFELIACTYEQTLTRVETVLVDKICNGNAEKVAADISEKTNKHVCIIVILTTSPFR